MGPIGGGGTRVALVLPLARVRAGERGCGRGREGRGRDSRTAWFAELERFPGLRGRFDPRRLVREVLVTGPFAQWSRASVADEGGALLVGDAADFFDPFTGQGIYSALRGAELAADTVTAVLPHRGSGGGAALPPHRPASPRRAPHAPPMAAGGQAGGPPPRPPRRSSSFPSTGSTTCTRRCRRRPASC